LQLLKIIIIITMYWHGKHRKRL